MKCLDSKDVIEQYCLLQEEVATFFDHEHAADCFCGKGGFWGSEDFDGSFEEGYRNDMEVFKFIQEAVREKIKAIKKTPEGVET